MSQIPTPWKTILVACDFAAGSREALSLAARLAVLHGASLHLVHAAEIAAEVASVEVHPDGEGRGVRADAHALRAGHAALEAAATAHRGLGLTMHLHVALGAPVDVIVEAVASTRADLLVMGTHGRSGLRRLVMGSVAESVLRRATIPVLTVRSASAEEHPVAAERDLEDELVG